MEMVKRVGQAIWVVIRLVLFGWGGFIVLLYGAVGLATYVEWMINPDVPYSPSPILALPIMVGGALLMLYGAGQWKRWAYLWVFFSMPISLLVLLLISIPFPFLADEEISVLFFGLAACVANAIVKKYYMLDSSQQNEEDSRPFASML